MKESKTSSEYNLSGFREKGDQTGPVFPNLNMHKTRFLLLGKGLHFTGQFFMPHRASDHTSYVHDGDFGAISPTDGAKLRCADVESEASHICLFLGHTLVQCERYSDNGRSNN